MAIAQEAQYVNAQQAAEITGLHPNTIYRHLENGTLKGIKLGGNTKSRQPWKIRVENLDAFIRGENQKW